jgi:hypothetical protein
MNDHNPNFKVYSCGGCASRETATHGGNSNDIGHFCSKGKKASR